MSARVVPRGGAPGSAGRRPSLSAVRLGGPWPGAFGDPPLAWPMAVSARAVVGAVLAGYGVCLVISTIVGSPAVGLMRAPLFLAALVLSGRGAIAVGAAATVMSVAALLVHPAPISTDQWLEIPFVIGSAILLRGLVVAAVATLSEHLRREADLAARLEGRAAQLGVLEAASSRMSRAGSVESVGRAVVEETRRIIDYHNARVYVLEPTGDLVPIAFEGRVGAYEQVDMDVLRCKLGEGFTGWVAEHGEAILTPNANVDPRGATIEGTEDVDESMLVVPMRYDEQIVGVITLSKLGLNQFDDDDLRLLSILADQAATALESAQLLARSRALAGELRLLLDMSSQLSGSLDPRQVANLIAKHLVLATEVDECAISYWDRAGGRVLTFGYFPPERVETMEPWFEIAGYPETLRVLQDQVTSIIDTEDPSADQAEVALLKPDGQRMLVMLPLVAKGQSIGLVELISKSVVEFDAQRLSLARTMANEAAIALENAQLYEDARNAADRDPLTGFYNHRFLHERLGEEVVRAQRSMRPMSVLMLDLDDFKLVNDTMGHLLGDRVLTWTAELIRSTLRTSDVPARYGGDEFAVLLPDTDAEAARHAAERILDAFQRSTFKGDARGELPVAVSIGVATFPRDGRAPTELIAAADADLYRVKRGRAPESAPPQARRSRAQAREVGEPI